MNLHHLDDVCALAGEVGSEHFKADVDDAGRGGIDEQFPRA
jgi:hypothetical protein